MYRYETHLHTSLVSACSRFTPEEIVNKYIRLGYAGVFVTDHFLNGNTTVPAFFPYAERIKLFCEGYRAVKKAAEGRDLDVFFGFEYSYRGTDFLVYGLDEEWLVKNPVIMEMSTKEFLCFAVQAGGLVVQAHPYREADYIDHIRLFPSDVHGMEMRNPNRDARTNMLADLLAAAYSLVRFAGSDIHNAAQKELAGMKFRQKITSERDFAERVKRDEGEFFTLTDGGAL